MIDAKVVRELEDCYGTAKDYADAFRDAVKAQAEKHDLDPQALGKWIRARYNDKLEKLQAEQNTIDQLSLFDSPIDKEPRNGSVAIKVPQTEPA